MITVDKNTLLQYPVSSVAVFGEVGDKIHSSSTGGGQACCLGESLMSKLGWNPRRSF